MRYIRITNLFPDNQIVADYKQLDISKFIPGSQMYDFKSGVCLVRTREVNIPSHDDLHELTEEKYESLKEEMTSEKTQELDDQPLLSEQVEELKQENNLLNAKNQALSERADFIEDVVAEMAMQVYQ